jgi:D-proline reductase (dithiol) PrdB
MALTSQLPLSVRLFLRGYRWRQVDPVPFAVIHRPVEGCTVGLVSSAGFVLPGMVPFDRGRPGGDSSWRSIPADAEGAELLHSHRSEAFDHQGMTADPELAFPMARLRELAEAGEVGRVAPHHASCMGSITATGHLVNETAPEIAARFVEDQVDLALLVPV